MRLNQMSKLFYFKYQDEVGGGFEKQQSLSGEISMLNMWDRLLTDLEVSRMAKCYGNYHSQSSLE